VRLLLPLLALTLAAQTRIDAPTQARSMSGRAYYYAGTEPLSIPANSCAEFQFPAPGAGIGDRIAPGWPESLPSGVVGVMRGADNAIVVRLCAVGTAAAVPSAVWSAIVIRE
jgi:hypothetical protein